MFVFHFIAIDQVEKKLSTMRNLVAVLALLASLAAGKFFRIHSLSLLNFLLFNQQNFTFLREISKRVTILLLQNYKIRSLDTNRSKNSREFKKRNDPITTLLQW